MENRPRDVYPFGYGFALMEDREAMARFSAMSESEQREAIRKLSAMKSEEEIREFLHSLPKRPLRS